MRLAAILAALGTIGLLVGTRGGFTKEGGQSPVPVRLRAGTFDPKDGVPERLRDAAPPAGGVTLRVPPGRGDLALVQFEAEPAAAQHTLLSAAGAKVIDFVPERTLVVRLGPGVDRDTLRSLEGVRAVVPYSAAMRRSSRLAELKKGGPGQGGPPSPREETVRLSVALADDGNPSALAEEVGDRFPKVKSERIVTTPSPRLQLSGAEQDLAAAADALARHSDVLFVDIVRPNRLLNDPSVWIGQSYNRIDGPGEAAAPDPKPYTLSGTLFQRGLTGTGQIIGVADTRLEHNLCFFNDPLHSVVKQNVLPPGALTLDPSHRKILAYNNALPGADAPPFPTWRHGTHTSGSASGDALAHLSSPSNAGHDTGDGMAPNAKIVYLDMYAGVQSNCTDAICAFCGVPDILTQEYNAGARISTNSWEADVPAGDEADASVWMRPDHLVLFSAGNDGFGGSTVQSAAGAKNVLAVGASESYDATFQDAFGIRDPENMAAFSTLGPAWDGRIKPDLTAPGVGIRSAAFPVTYYSSTSDPHCVSGAPDVCFPTFGGCYVNDLTQTCSTFALSGTSMSAPTAAGLAALARQYFTSGYYPSGAASPADARVPSAALLKAVLINGARNMTGRTLSGSGSAPRGDLGPIADAPSARQGWGRIMLEDGLYFGGDARRLFIADIPSVPGQGLGSGENVIFKVDNTSTTTPLKATLVWTDPPKSPGAAKDLRDDLDLIVTAPNGTVYKGNQWTADNVNVINDVQSAANPSGRDSLNNVEGFLIRNPQVGEWRFEIRGTSVPGYQGVFHQGYAVAITGAFTGQGNYCGTIPQPPQNFSVGLVAGNDIMLSWQSVPGATSYEVWRGTTCAPPPDGTTVIPASGTTLHDTSLQPATTYSYNVRALLNPTGCRTGPSMCYSITTPVAPTIQQVGPSMGDNNNPTQVSITGTNFLNTPNVWLGTASQPEKYPLSNVEAFGSTLIVATVPVNLQTGFYNLKVQNPNLWTATLNDAFFVGPPLQGSRLFATLDNTAYDSADSLGVYNLDADAFLSSIALTPYDDPITIAANRLAGTGIVGLWGAPPSGERGRLALLHLGSGTLTRTLELPNANLGWRPLAVDIDPQGTAAYVLNRQSNGGGAQRVSRFDLLTSTFTTLTIGNHAGGPAGLVVSPDGQRVYATNDADDTVSVIRLSDFTEIGRVTAGDTPGALAVSPDSTRLYVANTVTDTITVVNTSTLALIGTVNVGYIPNPSWHTVPRALVVSPDGQKLYVGFNAFYELAIVNTATLQMTTTTSASRQVTSLDYVSTQSKLYSVAFTPDVRKHNPTTLAVDLTRTFSGFSFASDWVSPLPLDIQSISPTVACTDGNIEATITGTGFQGEVRNDAGVVVQQRTRVIIGGNEVTSINLTNSTQLRVTVPPHSPGFVNVQVIHPNGQTDTLTNGLKYKFCVEG